MPIVFCADANYGLYLPVVVQSIIENSSENYHYHIIVLDCGIAKDVVSALVRQIRQYDNFSLHVKNIEDWLEGHKQAFEEKWHLTRAMYGRLFIPELCKGYDKVIYADIDMVFNRDIAELIEIDLGDNHIAGVVDVSSEVERTFDEIRGSYMRDVMKLNVNESYINSGFLIFNVGAWLDLNISEKAISLLGTEKLLFPDQDAINYACQGKIFFLRQEWNCLPKKYLDKWESRMNEIPLRNLVETLKEWELAHISSEASFHFTGRGKPWVDIHADKGSFWWGYAAKTSLYSRYINDFVTSLAERHIMMAGARHSAAFVKTYKALGIPFWTVKTTSKEKKYCIGKMRVAKKKYGKENTYLYILGLKLFSVGTKKS